MVYDGEVYECDIHPTDGDNTDYTCNGDVSLTNFNCGSGTDEMYIESFGGDDKFIIDRLYVTPKGGIQISYTISNSDGRVCISTDGADDGCPSATVSGLVNLDSGGVDYSASPSDCSTGCELSGSGGPFVDVRNHFYYGPVAPQTYDNYIYLSSNTVMFIGGMIALILLCNMIIMIKHIKSRKGYYQFVKSVDSECEY